MIEGPPYLFGMAALRRLVKIYRDGGALPVRSLLRFFRRFFRCFGRYLRFGRGALCGVCREQCQIFPQRCKGFRDQCVENMLSFFLGTNQPGFSEEVQMMADRRLGNGEAFRNLSGTAWSIAEQQQDLPAGGIGKGFPGIAFSNENILSCIYNIQKTPNF